MQNFKFILKPALLLLLIALVNGCAGKYDYRPGAPQPSTKAITTPQGLGNPVTDQYYIVSNGNIGKQQLTKTGPSKTPPTI